LAHSLRLQDNALQFFKNSKVFIGVVYLGVALFFRYKEADLFQPLKLALDITSILFNKFGEPTDVGFKIWVLSINHYDFASDPGSNKCI